jgi:hypothetical protein
MKKPIGLFSFLFCWSLLAHSQLMVSKAFGKNSSNSQLGYGTFLFLEFPLGQTDNRSIRVELLDFAFYPSKNYDSNAIIGYLSIKLGYKYVFSETREGFYIEPQAGWGEVIESQPVTTTTGTSVGGLALAVEGGYCWEVGHRGNTINAGIKYEVDDVGIPQYVLNSISFRVSFSFHAFARRDDQ